MALSKRRRINTSVDWQCPALYYTAALQSSPQPPRNRGGNVPQGIPKNAAEKERPAAEWVENRL